MSGNYGSGGHNRTHGLYEGVPRIDSFSIAPMMKILVENRTSYKIPLEWSRNGNKCASAMLYYSADKNELSAVYKLNGQHRQDQYWRKQRDKLSLMIGKA